MISRSSGVSAGFEGRAGAGGRLFALRHLGEGPATAR